MTTSLDQPIQQIEQDTVYALADSGDTLYAARISGMYRSDDGGATWQNTFVSLNETHSLSATAVATDGTTVFAGVKGAVLRSDDGGKHWLAVGLSSPPPQVVALAISPNYREDGVVVAGTAEDGVFVSNDQGATWTAWNFGLIDQNVYALILSPHFSADKTVFAGTESGVFRSHNGGRAWRDLDFPLDAGPVLSLALSVTDGRLYAGTENRGLFVSDDSGISWQQVDNGFASSSVNAIHIAASHDNEVWLLLEESLVCSFDGGRSWNQHAHNQIEAGKTAMAMLPHPTVPNMMIVGFADGDLQHISTLSMKA
jgi:photosystem II stability/assembly factor-like uncharacterized protein